MIGFPEKMTTVIIGGGIAGLYVAGELAKTRNVVLLESRSQVGGRCRTRYTKDGRTVLYETGPWRVHETHTRLRALLRKMRLDLTPSTTVVKSNKHTSEDSDGDISSWDAKAMRDGAPEARRADIASGYEGLLAATNASNVYHAQRHAGGKYFAILQILRRFLQIRRF